MPKANDTPTNPLDERSRTFRLFVSSTFHDLKAERNALHTQVFPRLRELCRRHDCSFQAIDMRWGVSELAALDQQTMIICLREIERCQRVTPRPNFLVLLGDRYGWRPSPARIPIAEFNALLEHVSAEEAELLRWWYRRDANASPPEYRLRSRQVTLTGCETTDEIEAERRTESASWGTLEVQLQRALARAARKASLPMHMRLKYEQSAVAQEIDVGALQVSDPQTKVFCCFRTLKGLPDELRPEEFVVLAERGSEARGCPLSSVARRCLDLIRDLPKDASPQNMRDLIANASANLPRESEATADLGMFETCLRNAIAYDYRDMNDDWRPDQDTEAQLTSLKRKLRHLVPDNVYEYEANWTGLSAETDLGKLSKNLDDCLALLDAKEQPLTFCATVWCRLARTILHEIERPTMMSARPNTGSRLPLDDGLDPEGRAHCEFANDLLRFFVGRETSRKIIREYLVGNGERILAVVAAGGSGKSALMAKGLEDAKSTHPGAQFVYRFVGATPSSSDGRSLLVSLCREIARRYGAVENTPDDFVKLVSELQKLMALAPADRPLILFLDALDQLSEAHGAQSLTWLPAQLPRNVRVLVSTRMDVETTAAVTRLRADQMGLDPMSRTEGDELLGLWLDVGGRQLTPDQRTKVLHAFERSGGRPLYLKFAFEEAQLWPSYVQADELHLGIEGVIRENLFRRLARNENHGEVLVGRAVGYLAASRYGLAEDELLDVLSRDTDLYASFLKGSFHMPSDVLAWAIEYRRRSGMTETKAEQDDTQLSESWLRALIKNPNATSELRSFLDEILAKRDGPRLPVVFWSRLLFDLAPYLTERINNGTRLLSFYHHELKEVGAQQFADGERGRELHSRLAAYFAQRELSDRKIEELPWQLAQAGAWQRLYELLADQEFFFIGWVQNRFEIKAHWARLEKDSSFRMVEAYHPIIESTVCDVGDRRLSEIANIRNVADLLAGAGYHDEALILRQYLLNYQRQVGEPTFVAMFLDDFAMSCRALGRTEEALRALQEKRCLLHDAPAEWRNDEQTIKTLNQLAIMLTDLGRLGEALECLQEQERLALATEDKYGLGQCFGNQARVFILQGRRKEAIFLLETQEQICRAEGDMDGLTHALGNLGAAFAEDGEIDRAEALFLEKETICRRMGNREGLAEALGARALIRCERGDYDGATELLGEQEQICMAVKTKAGLAACLGNQAVIAIQKRETDRALDLLEQQERLCRETGRLPELQDCFGHQAALRCEVGDVSRALEQLAEREQICRQIGLKYELATTLGLRAVLLKEQGDITVALELFREQEQLGHELGVVELQSHSLVGQAGILTESGEIDEALEVYRRAESAIRAADDLEFLRNALAEQADLLTERGELDEAFPVFQELERISRQMGHKRGLAHSLDNQGTILRLSGDVDRAVDKHEDAVVVLRETSEPADLAGALGNLGVALRAQGDTVGAMKSYLEAEEIWRRLDDKEGLQRLLGNKGNLLMLRNDLVGALRLFDERVEICRKHGFGNDLQKALLMQRMVHARLGDSLVELGTTGSAILSRADRTKEDHMKCDICSRKMNPKTGYILSTSEVLYDPGYWKRLFKLVPITTEQLENKLPSFVREMSSSTSDWMLCEECMGFLKADRSCPSQHYQNYVKAGKHPRLPDSGPAEADRAAIVASGAFEVVFGRRPASIKVAGPPGEVLSSLEFSEKIAEINESRDRSELGWLGSVQVQCQACSSIVPAVECQFTSSGMSCPRCDLPWFLLK